MPRLNLTKDQFMASKQSIQSRYIKIELLNYNFQTVDTVEGKTTGGNISIDSNSDIRRTGSITLTITDSTFEVEPGGKIWLDKYLRVLVGTRSLMTGEISWTNCGLFIIDAPSYHYDSANNTLTIGLLDLMAKLTGARNGYLKGFRTVFKAGQSIRDIMIGLLEFAGFTKYVIDNPPEPGKIPYDMEFDQGSTLYDLLKALTDIYPNHESFFDVNGVFVYQEIPTGDNDPVSVDDSIWDSVNASEDITVEFQAVKNSIEVYGRTHNPARFSTETTVDGNKIHLVSADVYHYFSDLIYGFTLTDNPGYTDMLLEINELGALPIYTEDNTTLATIPSEEGEVYYCVQYKEYKNEQGDVIDRHWIWLGHLQSYGFAEDTNPDSPFYVEGPVGRIRLPLYGGEYDNIFTDELAQQRAEYELYLHSNLNDSIILNCIPVYWLDVNLKAEYTMKRNGKKGMYMIKSISYGLAPTDTMTVNMMKFYPTATNE